MSWFRNRSIKTKLMLLMGLVAAGPILLTCGALMWNNVCMIQDSMVRTHTALAEVLGANAAAALTFDDPAAARETLASLEQEPGVCQAWIQDAAGNVFADYRAHSDHGAPAAGPQAEGHHFKDGYMTVVVDIRQGGERIGAVCLLAHMGEVRASIQRSLAIARYSSDLDVFLFLSSHDTSSRQSVFRFSAILLAFQVSRISLLSLSKSLSIALSVDKTVERMSACSLPFGAISSRSYARAKAAMIAALRSLAAPSCLCR